MLNNKASKSGKEEDKRLYKIQRNKVSKLNNKLKKTYFKEKLPKGSNVKDFWNYCKPCIKPMLFSLLINVLMFFIQETELCNFADDTTIYSCSPNFEKATPKLSNDTH